MCIEDVMDIQEKYGWDVKVIACCVVFKDKEGKTHTYSIDGYNDFAEVE